MGVTIINFLMNILLVYRSIHMFFFIRMIVYLLLYNFLYFSKCVSWASYANKAHRQVKNLASHLRKHNREGEIVKTNVKNSKYVTGIAPTNSSSTVQ